MAHIWFWPTSVVTMVSSSISLLISRMTLWGAMGTQSLSSSRTWLALTCRARSVHPGRWTGVEPMAHMSDLSAFLASACRLTH